MKSVPQEKRVKSAKIESQSQKYQIVEYDNSCFYGVWDRIKVIKTKDVVFDEMTQALITSTKIAKLLKGLLLEVELKEF